MSKLSGLPLLLQTKLTRHISIYEPSYETLDHLKPLTLFFCPFLGSKPQDEEKYLALYTDFFKSHKRPLYLMHKRTVARQFAHLGLGLMSATRTVDVIQKVLGDDGKLLFHGASIGAFSHATHLETDNHLRNGERYIPKIVGQLIDSPIYGGSVEEGLDKMVKGMTDGIPYPLLRKLVRNATQFFYVHSAQFKERNQEFIDAFINLSPNVPTLLITSEADPLMDTELLRTDVLDQWDKRGMDLRYYCFPDSKHVQHLRAYPDIYRELVLEYLTKVEAKMQIHDQEIIEGESSNQNQV